MLEDVLPFLVCPVCDGGFAAGAPRSSTLACLSGHTFDVARSGYVNLASGAALPEGDATSMVLAREAFLGSGAFEPVSAALADAAALAAGQRSAGCVVDLGAGTGHYLARVLDRLGGYVGLALEASKPALKRAAHCHPRAGAVGCDTRGKLPVRTGGAQLCLDVFAPRNGAEIHRILHRDGALLVITPSARHLVELREPLGLLEVDPKKTERLQAQLDPWLEPVDIRAVEFGLALTRVQAQSLVGMGPSARHLGGEAIVGRLAALPEPISTTVSVRVSMHRPR